mgnify:CR=1 FL=1
MRPIRVLVLRSHVGGIPTWTLLNERWSEFGPHALHITLLMTKAFTYSDLLAAHPDVIVCSDTAGCPSFFTTEEAAALKRYITRVPCCHLFGTYAAFYHVESNGTFTRQFDNRHIAPLFGFSETQTYTSTRTTGGPLVCRSSALAPRLWAGLSEEHCVRGYQSAKIPPGGRWVVDGKLVGGLPGARVVASDADDRIVVVSYRGAYHTSLYISAMPEYQAVRVQADHQVVYNCIVALYLEGLTDRLQLLCVRQVSDCAESYMARLVDDRLIEAVPGPVALELLRVVLARVRPSPAQCKYLEASGYGDVSRAACCGGLGSPSVRPYRE